MNKNIEYVYNSYRGYLNGILATSLLSSKEEVLEKLNYLEDIINKYDKDIIEQFFKLPKTRIQEFFNKPSDLIEALDFKQYPEKSKKIFDKFRNSLNEKITFKKFYDKFN